MSSIHPNWKATDKRVQAASTPPQPDQSSMPSAASAPIAGVHISRKPAAIVGILLVVGIGFGVVNGTFDLTGQIAAEADEDTPAIVQERSTEVAFSPLAEALFGDNLPSSFRSDPPPPPAAPAEAPAARSRVLPSNPHAAPAKASAPSVAQARAAHAAVTQRETAGKGKGKPFRQPETGAGLWLVVASSLACVLLYVQRLLQTQVAVTSA